MASEGKTPVIASALEGSAESIDVASPSDQIPRKRVPLRANRRRLSYDLRLRLWLVGAAVPTIVCACWVVAEQSASPLLVVGTGLGVALFYSIAAGVLFEQITRPLQTLSNVVAALREDDFSFRARGARRGDSLGDLALEINSLAGTLQGQRGAARDALTLAERVMGAMRTPVLAFTADGLLRSLNPAAEQSFGLLRLTAVGRSADVLGLKSLFLLQDGAVHTHPAVSGVAGEKRWSLRRSSFRLGGVPHTLFVLSDVDAALREEERMAWQRLVRVLSHEINNSLTPITSLAGSLQARLPAQDMAEATVLALGDAADLRRGLHLIEDRAVSLHRFLQAYQQLARLPRPVLRPVVLGELLQRVTALETRCPVQLAAGPELVLALDGAQIEQLLINLLRNAVEAALSVGATDREVSVRVRWAVRAGEVAVEIEDDGPGLTETANLFVPFYTTKQGGSGIGLVLAQQIAQAHGGTLTLSNRAGSQGCVAVLQLPASLVKGSSGAQDT